MTATASTSVRFMPDTPGEWRYRTQQQQRFAPR